MKKLFSISCAFIILLSGIHLSIATHYCGGEIAAVKWSFSAEKATCGMESSEQSNAAGTEITSNCCRNEISVLTVDNNYNSTSFHIEKITTNPVQVFSIPANFSLFSSTTSISLRIYLSPSGNLLASAVSLPEICIFRI